jgi:nicotinate dehydrogenase subunit A
MAISITVNRKKHEIGADTNTPLLYVLRNDLELNGAKYGCGLSQCGACTVIVEGKAVRSCVTQLSTVAGKTINPIEGFGEGGKLHALQKAFLEEQAAQCGYCANGMIMTAKALLDKNPRPTEAQIRKAMAANFCRCGTHNRIVRAIQRAAKQGATT